MRDFMIHNWFLLLIAIILVAYEVYLVITKQWTKLRMQAYALMLTAERIFGAGQGKEKFEAVFRELYNNLIPSWLRLFITPEGIREKLQEWYDLAKDYLSDGVVDGKK